MARRMYGISALTVPFLVFIYCVSPGCGADVLGDWDLGKLETGQYTLTVKNEIHGKIKWVEMENQETVKITVSSLTDTSDMIMAKHQIDEKNIQVTVTQKTQVTVTQKTQVTVTQKPNTGAASHVTTACRFLIGALVVVTCSSHVTGSWGRRSLLGRLWMTMMVIFGVLSFTFMTVTGDGGQESIGADVLITTPKGFSFAKVILTASDSSIEIPPSTADGSLSCSIKATDCASCCHGNGVCIADKGCQCNNGFYAADNCLNMMKEQGADIDLHVNPSDPVLMTVRGKDGSEIRLWGTRDRGSGRPFTLDAISMIEPQKTCASGRPCEYRVSILDDLSPESILSVDEVRLAYNWRTGGRVVVNAQSPQTTDALVNIKDAIFKTPKQRKRRSEEKDVKTEQNSVNDGDVVKSVKKRQISITKDIPIFIITCAVSIINAEVWGQAQSKDGKLINYLASNKGNGLYQIHIPQQTSPAPKVIVSELCLSVKTQFELHCPALQQRAQQEADVLCSKLKQELSNANTATDKFETACRRSFEVPVKACEFLTKSDASSPSAFDDVCENPVLFDIYTEQGRQIDLKAYTILPDHGWIVTTAQTIDLSASITANFMPDINTSFKLLSMNLAPVVPQASFGYKLSITFTCAENGGRVVMEIKDTATSQTVLQNSCQTVSQTSQSCQVESSSVSGGTIHDTVVITYSNANGVDKFTKKMLIVT